MVQHINREVFMITRRKLGNSFVRIVLIVPMLAGPSWLAYGQSCGCANLDDIANFANTQVEAGNVYKSARDKYADEDRAGRKTGRPPAPYDDGEYNKVMKASGNAKTCPAGGKDIGASTSGLTCNVSYSWRNCGGPEQSGVPDACMQSLVDAHEGVHQKECNLGKDYNGGVLTNYKTNQTMTQSMDEEVKAHKAGWKKAVDEFNSILDEWCCGTNPPTKNPPKAGAAVKPTLGEIVRNLLK
jgi:hypothetical protein